jgi:SAM-dependent methyltransferase
VTALFPEAVDRDPLDFNRTPAWCVELLVPYLGQPRTIIDAGCGDGAIGKALRAPLHSAVIIGVETHAERLRAAVAASCPPYGSVYDDVIARNWLEDHYTLTEDNPDLIISNPPFGLAALDFLQCAIARVRPGGTVAFLLPTHWDQDVDANCGPDAPKTKDRELYQQRISHEQYARQRFLDSIRLPDGREGYTKLAIVGGGPNPCRPSFRGGAESATDRYSWFMFGKPWAGQPPRRLHAIPPAAESPQLRLK